MASTVVNHAALVNLSQEMDELKHQATSLMSRYEECFNHAQSSKAFAGSAGAASVASGGEIHDAQMRIQQKFEQVNELLRHGAATYTSTDQDNQHHIQSVASHIKLH
jgi:uncharacterized protein YukE